MREAESFEERRAWKKVIQWFDDILSRKYLNHNNAIGIPMVDISELNREEDLEKWRKKFIAGSTSDTLRHVQKTQEHAF